MHYYPIALEKTVLNISTIDKFAAIVEKRAISRGSDRQSRLPEWVATELSEPCFNLLQLGG
jgi:hypothetical protein